MPKWNGLLLIVTSCLMTGGCALSPARDPGPEGPPVAAVEPVVEALFGTRVSDPYRWMEDRNGPRFTAWARGQAAYARAALDRIPGHDALRERIARRTAGGVVISQLKLAGDKVFYLRRVPGDDTAKLVVRDGDDRAERVLIDPDLPKAIGTHRSIDYYAPAADGSKVAYAVSEGGSEQSVLRIIDVASGRESPESIDRTEYGSPSWLPGANAFFYNRFAKVAADAGEIARYQNSRAMLHVVGTDPAQDRALAGTGVDGSPLLTAVDTPSIVATPGSRHALLFVSHGADPANTIYVAPLDAVVRGRAAWRLVADVAAKVTDAALAGERLFLLSFNGASRRQVLETDARSPAVAAARAVVPAGNRVIQGIDLASDALFVRDLEGGIAHLRRMDLASGALDDVPLPLTGSMTSFAADALRPGALLGLQGWVSAPGYFRVRADGLQPIALVPPWREDLDAYTSEETTAIAADGTSIPLSIVHRKGLVRDGNHPVWLTGYGAYGIPLTPVLVARFLTLLDDGGVYAVAHVRGGGEFGEDWHAAGRFATKPNTYLDLIACAEALVERGYGRPSSLAIEGRSAGGITVGMATTARPDLFRVVFNGVGDNNVLRSEFGTDGPANALEYGSIATEAGFRGLLAVDATQHVKAGTAYPAVLLTAGMNDPRVAPWQPGKMAAHLQAATSSGRPVLFLVDFDAGHGMGSTKAQRDQEMADQLSFFYWQIGVAGYQPIGTPSQWRPGLQLEKRGNSFAQ